MFLLFQSFTNNLIAYKLFKSNLARVLRTSNHILVLAAMTIFGHIFPFLWVFFYYLLSQIFVCPPLLLWKTWPFFLSSGFSVPTSRIPLKKLSFCILSSFSWLPPAPSLSLPNNYWASTMWLVFFLLILRTTYPGRLGNINPLLTMRKLKCEAGKLLAQGHSTFKTKN